MSGYDDYAQRLRRHQIGGPVVDLPQNVAEASADADAAAARNTPAAIPAANLGGFLRLWDKGPAGRGLFLLVLSLVGGALGGSLPGIFGMLGVFLSLVLSAVSLGMIAYGIGRALLRRR